MPTVRQKAGAGPLGESMTRLPTKAPLTPPECDLRGLEYMPLLGNHLYGSDFDAAATDAEYRAAQRLWWAAWNQKPAGSLPDNDDALCKHAGMGYEVKRWLKVKQRALHGFVECSDGRLYHEFLCKQAVIAWEKRQAERLKNEADARRKRAERDARSQMFEALREVGIAPAWNVTTAELKKLVSKHVAPDEPAAIARPAGAEVTRPVVPPVARSVASTVTPPVTRTGDVTEAGQSVPPVTAKTGRDETGREEIPSGAGAPDGELPDPPTAGPLRTPPPSPPSPPSAPALAASPTAIVPDPRKQQVWSDAKALLQGGGLARSACGAFVGKLVRDFGFEIVADAVAAACLARPPDPRGYLTATCQRLVGQRLSPKQHGDALLAQTMAGLTGNPGINDAKADADTIDVESRVLA